MSLTAKLIWYVERHLDRPLSLSRVAKAHGVSAFHVTRLFAVTCGQPLMSYVKARRLSEGAKALIGGAGILEAAMTAGYGSHEAFTRAFRDQFGMPPRALKRREDRNPSQKLALTEPLSMNDHATRDATPVQTPRLVNAPSVLVAGLSGSFDFANLSGIPGLWQALRAYYGHIEGQVGGVAYGVSYNYRPGGLDYLAAIAIDGNGALPDDFVTLKLSAGRFAVFEHRGHVSDISWTWRQICDSWLSEADLTMRHDVSFERMDERFDDATGMGVVEIWVPVD